VERIGSDDELVCQPEVDDLRRERPCGLSYVEKGGGEASQVSVIEEFKCEMSVWPSDVECGGGDALKLIEEWVNPYEEMKKSMCGDHISTNGNPSTES
jgi:hypothetical protein